MQRPRRSPPPLDGPALERLALRYVERYATTRGKLAEYLGRKLRERGWAEERDPAPAALAERLAGLGYIDDRGFAASRVAAMGRRGLGARRIAGALHLAHIDAEDAEAVRPDIDAQATASAFAFARRKRIGPFSTGTLDRAAAQRAVAAMLRAGHGFDLARRIVAMQPGSEDAFDGEESDAP